MSGQTFGEKFVQSRGCPIEYEGLTIHSIHRLAVPSPLKLIVQLVRFTPSIRQAIRITAQGGTLVVSGQTRDDIALWTDTAPRRTEIHVRPGDGHCVVKMWNAWEDEMGVMQAWIGDCGMLVEHRGSGLLLRCSDGVGGPDFDDLVADIELVG